jgi:hypothetical protein
MATYRVITHGPLVSGCFCKPANAWEWLHLCWYVWRYPDKVTFYMAIPNEYLTGHCKALPEVAANEPHIN